MVKILLALVIVVTLLAGFFYTSPSVDVSAQEPLPSTRITKDWGYEYTALTGDKIEVGDKSTTEFKPTLKLERWGGEAYIKVSLPTTEKTTPKTTTEKVVWEGQTVDAHFYPLEPTEQYELGGFEFEVILKEKPLTNKIVLNFETQNLKFYYQPPLTEEFESGWSKEFQCDILVTETEVTNTKIGDILVHRPENVVGSYAVYHATKGGMVTPQDVAKGITTGQGFMIYRPKMIDARGAWVWGEQLIDLKMGKQIITIPQWFLDTATYPIRHAAGDTFGWTNKGGSSHSGLLSGVIRGLDATGAAGTGTSISLYVSDAAATPKIKCALYKADESFVKGTVEWTYDESDGFHAFNFTDNPTVEAINYVICGWADGLVFIWYNVVANAGEQDSQAYDGWPTPASFTNWGVQISIYCTYTPDVGVVAPTVVTNNATAVQETTATLSGNITATGGENCTARGFQWDIDTGAPYADNWTEAGSFGVGNFTHGATSLPTGTTIYYRAGANNTAGWGWGSEVTFLTKTVAPPVAPSGIHPEVVPEVIVPSVGTEHIAWFIPLVLFSVLAFRVSDALLFMLAGGSSLMIGFRWYDLFTTNVGLSVGILLVAYSLVCLGFALQCIFWRERTSEE